MRRAVALNDGSRKGPTTDLLHDLKGGTSCTYPKFRSSWDGGSATSHVRACKTNGSQPNKCVLKLLVIVLFFSIIAAQESASLPSNIRKKEGLKKFIQKFFPRRQKTPRVAISNTTNQSWIDEVGEKMDLFFKNNIFGQEKTDDDDFLTLVRGGTKEEVKQNEEDNPFLKLFNRLVENGSQEEGREEKGRDSFVSELLKRTTLVDQSDTNKGIGEIVNILKDAISNSIAQMKEAFGDILPEVGPAISVSMIYYLANREAKLTPSWKRQQHRFYEEVTKPLVIELHDALYLSQLAYVRTVEEFRAGLDKFQSGIWELAYGTTESLPSLPAHFLLIHKHLSRKSKNELQITLVIRGTKDLADAIADTTLELTDYRGGKAHSGILASGQALKETYTLKLQELLKHSGKDRIRLYIVGHSLGAGAGAIAAMEFNEIDYITVEAVGFGCPSLLSPELSESTKDFVTTVVADSDVVPRMSGASMMNALLDLIDYDWTVSARDDLNFTLERAEEATPFALIKGILPPKESVVQWTEDFFNRTIAKPTKKKHDRLAVSLIPPGNCIHFFRDGVGFTGTHTPCKLFSSVEFSRTMLEDHLVMPGYHRALVTIMRDWNNDFNVS